MFIANQINNQYLLYIHNYQLHISLLNHY